MTEFLYICGIKVIGTNNLKHRNMKKNKLWMLAAILICGASVFTSCNNTDRPVSKAEEPVIDNLAEKVIGKWIVDEKDGKPALTNQKLVISFESATKVGISLSYQAFWQSHNEFEYKIDGNVISCAKQMDEHTFTNTVVKVKSIDADKMVEDFSNTISIDGVEAIKMESKETLKRVTDDYTTAILGLWEGRATSEMSSEFDDGEEHRWEYKADGKFYFYNKVNGEWQLSDDALSDYFVDGPLLCTRWKNNGENTTENREWWEIESIKDGVMKWTALRQKEDGTTYTATFEMTKVE